MPCPDVPELFRLWTAGLTMDDIAGEFGVSRTVIRAWRQRYKLPPRRSRFARVEVDPTPDELEQRKREIRERHLAEMRAMG